jgi:potassium-dependent mechanosensitive channel
MGRGPGQIRARGCAGHPQECHGRGPESQRAAGPGGEAAGQLDEIQTRTAEWITTFQTQLPLIWKAEFLDAKEFRLLPASGAGCGKDLLDWFSNLKTLFAAQYSSVTQERGDWVGMLVLFWLPFVFIGFAAYRFLEGVFRKRPRRRAADFGFRHPLPVPGLVPACRLSGRAGQADLPAPGRHACAHAAGRAGPGLGFSQRAGDFAEKSLQPLLPLVFLSISVSVLDLLRLPQWMEHLSWVGLVVLSSLFFGMIQPELRYERLIRRAHPYVMAILVAVAVLGWGNLAVLASTLWGVLALALQLGIGATSVVRVLFEKLDKTGFKALVADLAVTFLTLLVWLAVVLGIMAWVSINLGTNVVYEKLSTLELNWGDFSFNFLRLGVVLLLFQVVRSLALAWKTVLDSENLRWKNIDHGAAASLQRIGIYCLWLLFGLVSVNLLGISLTNFAVIAGGLSVGIGFGMQAIISNFISGLILLFDRAIQPGDVIEVNGVWAKVMSVNIRNTEVQTFDNAKIFLPNSTLIANQVTNWTHRNDVRIRRDVAVGVAYGRTCSWSRGSCSKPPPSIRPCSARRSPGSSSTTSGPVPLISSCASGSGTWIWRCPHPRRSGRPSISSSVKAMWRFPSRRWTCMCGREMGFCGSRMKMSRSPQNEGLRQRKNKRPPSFVRTRPKGPPSSRGVALFHGLSD